MHPTHTSTCSRILKPSELEASTGCCCCSSYSCCSSNNGATSEAYGGADQATEVISSLTNQTAVFAFVLCMEKDCMATVLRAFVDALLSIKSDPTPAIWLPLLSLPQHNTTWLLKLWDDQASITDYSEKPPLDIRTLMISHLTMHSAQFNLTIPSRKAAICTSKCSCCFLENDANSQPCAAGCFRWGCLYSSISTHCTQWQPPISIQRNSIKHA